MLAVVVVVMVVVVEPAMSSAKNCKTEAPAAAARQHMAADSFITAPEMGRFLSAVPPNHRQSY